MAFKFDINPNAKLHDPWSRRDAWRRHPYFSKASQVRGMAPGLGIATGLFIVYCGYDYFASKSSSSSSHGHGSGKDNSHH